MREKSGPRKGKGTVPQGGSNILRDDKSRAKVHLAEHKKDKGSTSQNIKGYRSTLGNIGNVGPPPIYKEHEPSLGEVSNVVPEHRARNRLEEHREPSHKSSPHNEIRVYEELCLKTKLKPSKHLNEKC